MRILLMIRKEFVQNIRNWKANCMMILFPIVLIIILGAAFSGVFDRSVKIGEVKVLYTVDCSRILEDRFKEFVNEHGKDINASFEETGDPEQAKEGIRNNRYTCYVSLTGNPDGIKIYKNDMHNSEANLVQSILKLFSDRYGAAVELFKYNPAAAGQIMADVSMDFTRIESLDKKRQPGSLDYYAVTMLTLILMYASQTGFWGLKTEQNLKTGNRLLCSPIKKYEYLTGKVIGCILVTVVQALVVILFSRYVLKAWWGNDLATVFLVVLTLSIMTISMGTGVAYLIKNDGAASGILNTVIPLVVFFGGGYTPLENLGPGIQKLSGISPLKWTNDAIFRVIYNNDYSLVLTAVLVNLAAAAAFIAVSAVLSRKEAV